MKIFLFAGAGASYELGIPTMDPMVTEFWSYLSRTTLTEDQIELLRDDLTDSTKDMEAIIEDSQRIVQAGETTDRYSDKIRGPGHTALFKKLLYEAEWFVQNACRRVDIMSAELLWGPTLEALSEHELELATSNYDRAIEIAADNVGIGLEDGFSGFDDDETADWIGFEDSEEPSLYKMHGSLDWFRTDDEIVKLRHPLSLFGDLEVNVSGSEQLRNCLILPSMEKQKNESPFTNIDREMQFAANDADLAIFLGTSLRDPDLKDLVAHCTQSIPTFVVSPEEQSGMSDIHHIRATASEFLISIVPAAVASGNIDIALNEASEDQSKPTAILDPLKDATDVDSPSRVESIEMISDSSISLRPSQISRFLNDEDPRVRLYALGLVPHCHDPDSLYSKVEELADNDSAESVQEEATLLLDFMENEKIVDV